MSVHRTKMGKWEVRWREGTRNRSRTFDRKADAARFDGEARRLSQLGGIVPRRVGGTTLGDFAEGWLERKQDLAPKTLRTYAQLLDCHVEPYLGHLPLTELRPQMLDRWQHERLAGGAGREAIAKASKLLAQILDRAVALELVTYNAARTLERPRAEPRIATPATPDQVEEIRGWFLERERLGDATLVSVLAYVGPRPMEALALRWEDRSGDRLLVERALTDGAVKTTKTRHRRVVEIPGPVAQDLAEWKLALGARRGLVWPRRSDGRPWRQGNWDNWRRRQFDKATEAVGLEDFRPYDLRHTAASLAIAAGRPLTEVAAQLGHSPEVSARTYAHLIELARGKPVRPVEEWIRAARDDGRERRAG